jgi:hypothetical protein
VRGGAAGAQVQFLAAIDEGALLAQQRKPRGGREAGHSEPFVHPLELLVHHCLFLSGSHNPSLRLGPVTDE